MYCCSIVVLWCCCDVLLWCCVVLLCCWCLLQFRKKLVGMSCTYCNIGYVLCVGRHTAACTHPWAPVVCIHVHTPDCSVFTRSRCNPAHCIQPGCPLGIFLDQSIPPSLPLALYSYSPLSHSPPHTCSCARATTMLPCWISPSWGESSSWKFNSLTRIRAACGFVQGIIVLFSIPCQGYQ